MGWANVASTSFAGPNPAAIHKAAPSNEVMARGRASVLQLTTTHVRMAESVCAEGGSVEKGLAYTKSASTGAAYRPTCCLIPHVFWFPVVMPMRGDGE